MINNRVLHQDATGISVDKVGYHHYIMCIMYGKQLITFCLNTLQAQMFPLLESPMKTSQEREVTLRFV